MKEKKKIKNLCFCLLPTAIGVLIIFFGILNTYGGCEIISENKSSWAFFWVFIGLVLISYSTVSIYEVCKRG